MLVVPIGHADNFDNSAQRAGRGAMPQMTPQPTIKRLAVGVDSNAQLNGLRVQNFPNCVWRYGVSARNVPAGVPPLLFCPQSTACSLNSGAGDGGSQVRTVDGGCAIARLPGKIDVREFGCIADGATDNTACISAVSVVATDVYFPPGNFHFASAQALSVPAGGSLRISGSGSDQTILSVPASTDLFDISVNGPAASVHLDDFTCTTASTSGSATCVALTQTTTAILNSANTAQSDFTNITRRGADGYEVTDYWPTCISTGGVSNINFDNDDFVGPSAAASAIGVNLSGGTSTRVPVVFNFAKSTFNTLEYGIYYGNYIQGVTVGPGNNFVGDTDGIYAPSSDNGDKYRSVDRRWFAVRV
jgi:hypothetical protein